MPESPPSHPKATKQVVAYGFTTPITAESMRQLRDTHGVNPVVWFAKPDIVPECTHHLYRLHRYPAKPGGAPEELIQYVFRDLMTFLEMYSRSHRDKQKLGLPNPDFHEHMDIMHQALNFLADLFSRERIDAVIFSNVPHIGPDFLLYKTARFYNIPTLIAFQSQFPNKFMLLLEPGGFGRYDTLPEKPPQEEIVLNKRVPPFYMNRKFGYQFGFGELCKSLAKDLGKDLLKGSRKNLLKRHIYLQKYLDYREYRANLDGMTNQTPDLNKPFVYVPLQLQPELTTSALGGVYSDQALAIERLSTLLPADWIIYIKENPGQTEYRRGDSFFKRLRAIPNVKFVPISTSTFDLIENCRFVATVTGTAGWEAIQAGKPALAFGQVGYKSLPGVIGYRPDLTIDDLLGNRIDPEQLLKALNSLVGKMEDGVTDCLYTRIVPNFDVARNARTVSESIKRLLDEVTSPSGKEAVTSLPSSRETLQSR